MHLVVCLLTQRGMCLPCVDAAARRVVDGVKVGAVRPAALPTRRHRYSEAYGRIYNRTLYLYFMYHTYLTVPTYGTMRYLQVHLYASQF